jgi:hypothetical protein
MGRDRLRGGVHRIVSDHRSAAGRRVTAYMRGLVDPFIPVPSPWEPEPERKNGALSTPLPPAYIREQARTAGRLLLEEDALVAELTVVAGRRQLRGAIARRRNRLERRLLAVRGMRLGIEKLLAERARQKGL